jgi:hypothetical protein
MFQPVRSERLKEKQRAAAYAGKSRSPSKSQPEDADTETGPLYAFIEDMPDAPALFVVGDAPMPGASQPGQVGASSSVIAEPTRASAEAMPVCSIHYRIY